MKISLISQNFQRNVNVWSVGFLQYKIANHIQQYLANLHFDRSNKAKPLDGTIIIVEHSPVYTTGIRTQGYPESEERRLKALGAEFYRTNRGGLITFHGPGQLVVYPILNLKSFNKSMKWYICKLEETVISVCKSFGVQAERSSDTGVWVKNKKICAIGISHSNANFNLIKEYLNIGVHGSRYITTHGIAMNINNDLSWFSHIVPCGIPDKGVTTLSQELGKPLNITDVMHPFLEYFSNEFECDVKMLPCGVRKDVVNHLKKENLTNDAIEEQLLQKNYLKF